MTNTEISPRQRRREATTHQILETAWALCREDGLASLSLRQLAKRVGMQAPSLYSYFDSKNAIYDAMFTEGQHALAARMADVSAIRPVTRDVLRAGIREWFAFCVEDPTRYQLLFQRTIPGFEPSAESYALALAQLDSAAAALHAAGVTDPAALDIWTALLTGLTSQQISNDPGGDRWARVLDQSVDMFLDHVGVPPTTTTSEGADR